MSYYIIENTAGGGCLGIYQDDSPEDALDQAARLAGYADHATLGRDVPGSTDGTVAREIEAAPAPWGELLTW